MTGRMCHSSTDAAQGGDRETSCSRVGQTRGLARSPASRSNETAAAPIAAATTTCSSAAHAAVRGSLDYRVTRACSSPTTMLVEDARFSVICPDEPAGPVQSTTQTDVADTG